MRKNTHRLLHLFFSSSLALTMSLLSAGGIREHTRPNYVNGAAVSTTQAVELTLTLVENARQNLQTWVRMAAKLHSSCKILSASLCSADVSLFQLDQRVRAFSTDSISSIYQARVSRIVRKNGCATIEVTLAGNVNKQNALYVIEVIVQRGQFMAIPKEAIIEEGNRKVAYIRHSPGYFIPKIIRTGLKGELYTEIISGLNPGDKVVTLGSFFVDAEFKLKATDRDNLDHAHLNH